MVEAQLKIRKTNTINEWILDKLISLCELKVKMICVKLMKRNPS